MNINNHKIRQLLSVKRKVHFFEYLCTQKNRRNQKKHQILSLFINSEIFHLLRIRTCPGVKCIDDIFVPTGSKESGVTRNSINFLLGSNPAAL